MAESFAVVEDLEGRWRPLTPAERARAGVLLGAASRRVRRQFPETDARVASGDLDPLEVVDVVAGMVKRVLMGGDTESLTQQSQTAGPFSLSQSFGNPMGDLYFTANDVATLSEGGARRAFSIDLTPRV